VVPARSRSIALLAVALAAPAGCAPGRRAEAPPAPSSQRRPFEGAPAPPAATQPQKTAAVEVGLVSYYSKHLIGKKTASGERYDPNLLTAAHRRLPFGTMVEVRREDGRSVVVRINDRGPFVAGRVIDVSHRAAKQLDLFRAGTVKVEVRPIGR
jgi:rare lipoprotein A